MTADRSAVALIAELAPLLSGTALSDPDRKFLAHMVAMVARGQVSGFTPLQRIRIAALRVDYLGGAVAAP